MFISSGKLIRDERDENELDVILDELTSRIIYIAGFYSKTTFKEYSINYSIEMILDILKGMAKTAAQKAKIKTLKDSNNGYFIKVKKVETHE